MRVRTIGLRRSGAVLAMIAGVCLPALAEAQTRLEAVYNTVGRLQSRGSYDGGATWGPFTLVEPIPCFIEAHGGGGFAATAPGGAATAAVDILYFDGAPALVSDQTGYLRAVGRATNGGLYWGTLTSSGGWQPCWFHIGGPRIRIGSDDYTWNPDSFPAVSSHANGRFDVFIVARRVRDGALSLLHAYPFNGYLNWRWEFLGSGLLSGTPGVTSWGPGRIDVFVRAANVGLAHKWFDNGRWSSGWEDMGASLMSSVSVASAETGHLDIYGVCTDQTLCHRWFSGGWSNWESLGGILGVSTIPSATSAGWGNVEVFTYDASRLNIFRRTWSYWFGWGVTYDTAWPYYVPMSAAHWWAP